MWGLIALIFHFTLLDFCEEKKCQDEETAAFILADV